MDFFKFASERYSVRKFKPDAVENEKIDKILQAANVAPTACNYQPQKIYVVKDPDMREALGKVSPCTFHAPVIIVVGYDNQRSAKGMVTQNHDFGDTDAAIVCTHMMFQAWELGLGSCWVGMFNEERVRGVLNIPENIRIRELLPIGYPAEDSKPGPLHTKFRASEDMVIIL